MTHVVSDCERNRGVALQAKTWLIEIWRYFIYLIYFFIYINLLSGWWEEDAEHRCRCVCCTDERIFNEIILLSVT